MYKIRFNYYTIHSTIQKFTSTVSAILKRSHTDAVNLTVGNEFKR